MLVVQCSFQRGIKNGSLSTVVGRYQLRPREDDIRSLFLYVQSNQNPFFKVFKVPETKGISFNDFDEIIGSFQFGIGIRQFHGIQNLVFIL